jgi:hypothetical protein
MMSIILFLTRTRKVKHQDNNVDGMDELEAKLMKTSDQEASWLQSMQEHRGILVGCGEFRISYLEGNRSGDSYSCYHCYGSWEVKKFCC